MSERQLFELDYSVHKGARGSVTGTRNICIIVFSVMPGARNLCMGSVSCRAHLVQMGALSFIRFVRARGKLVETD